MPRSVCIDEQLDNIETIIRYDTLLAIDLMTLIQNLHEHIISLATSNPRKTAILVCDQRGTVLEEITREELPQKIKDASAYLHAMGLKSGDRVALAFNNSAKLLILSWAAWSTGIVTVPLDMKRDTVELREYKIKESDSKLLITQEEFSKSLHNTVQSTPSGVTLREMPDLSHEALILFTSGTTARPKGARLTLKNLIVNAEGIIEWLRIQENDRFLVQLPLHHINSTTFCLASVIAGASIAIPPMYSNSHFWEQVANSGATFTSVVPSIIFDQLSRVEEFKTVKNLLKLNRIQLGSAPVVAGDASEFMKKFSIPLYQGYGQTETALRVTGVPMNTLTNTYKKLVAENSIGTPMRWAQVEIADTSGKILGDGQEGELIVKGPAVMSGYLGDEPAFRDGYFLTGDIGYWKKIDGQRFFFLIGRAKEIIIKGGVNISPISVENALKKISNDIEQAYVIGVEDKRYGEEVGAVIVWKDDIESNSAVRQLKLALLIGHEVLSTYETPKYLVAVRADELSMTSTGKVQRTILRKNLTGKLESLCELTHNDDYKFEIIPPQSPFAEKSYVLYNHCWQPLTKNGHEYKKYLDEYLTLGAIDKKGTLAGQISFSYADNKITCVSICSANFKPKQEPVILEIPSVEFVKKYLLAGNDPVMNFHKKLGAELIKIIPDGRPDDKSSLGYTMLLRYPTTEIVKLNGQVSNQLIQAVRILANDVVAEMYAVSRPGGLASYLNRAV